jgi:RHS repeat-associated protein
VERSVTIGSTTTTSKFVYDGDQVILRLDVQNQVTDRFLWGPAVDMLLAHEEVNGSTAETFWTLGDHQNSVREYVSYDGATIENQVAYNAFGKRLYETNPAAVDTLFGFTGKPLDESTGLQNNVNRWYDPVLHQWLSEDPLGLGLDENPRRYVGNDPVNFVDPDGLDKIAPSSSKAFGLANTVMWQARSGGILGLGSSVAEEWPIGEDKGESVHVNATFGGGWIRKEVLEKLAARNSVLKFPQSERTEAIRNLLAGWVTHEDLSQPSISAYVDSGPVMRANLDHPAKIYIDNKLAAIHEWFTVDPLRTDSRRNDSHHSRVYHRIVKPAVVDGVFGIVHDIGSAGYAFAMAQPEQRVEAANALAYTGWQFTTDDEFRIQVFMHAEQNYASMSELDRQDAAVQFAGGFIVSELALMKVGQLATTVAPIRGAAGLEGRFMVNAGRTRRSIEEAIEIATRYGVEVGDDVRLIPGGRSLLHPGNRAEYFHLAGEHVRRGQLFAWDDLLVQGKSPVRIRKYVLISDEAIVATLAHETHEINALRTLFQHFGSLSAETLRDLLNAPFGTLHREALRIESYLLSKMKGN